MIRLNYILIKNINYILEKKTNQNKLKSKIIQEKTQEELKKNVPQTETEIEKTEQNVADDILNNI